VREWLAAPLSWLLRAWLATLRVRRVGVERLDALREAGTPVVFALWHSDQLLVLPGHNRERPCVLVSRSRDGSLLTGVLDRFGYAVVRGSSSRGGAAGLRGLLRALGEGLRPTLAVDGPRGPAGTVAPGVVGLARRSGAVVVPVAAAAGWGMRLGSWDRTRLPWPASRAVVVYGEPLSVAGDLDAGRAAVQAGLAAATSEAERLAR